MEKEPQLVTNESATPCMIVVPKGFVVRNARQEPVANARIWVANAGSGIIQCSDICDDEGRVTRDLRHDFPARVAARTPEGEMLWIIDGVEYQLHSD